MKLNAVFCYIACDVSITLAEQTSTIHKKCSKVYLSLYLERKVNGSYGTYKYWNFTANNTDELEKTIDVAVPSGTYYRVRGYHAASQSGTKESTSTLTQGIMVK